ncbi:hypothetical protein BDW74DRAFT_149057 [Aspergillus multicolor]|uniref:uncharacterized protein n=1 Tax=Aspergillus multicolor TaxID=41759 RepID=UPI003CCE477B
MPRRVVGTGTGLTTSPPFCWFRSLPATSSFRYITSILLVLSSSSNFLISLYHLSCRFRHPPASSYFLDIIFLAGSVLHQHLLKFLTSSPSRPVPSSSGILLIPLYHLPSAGSVTLQYYLIYNFLAPSLSAGFALQCYIKSSNLCLLHSRTLGKCQLNPIDMSGRLG